jgi:glycosyltransferase involved in cell wall biosynthesis
MRVVLAGPILTSSLRTALGLRLPDAPPGIARTPLEPLAAALRAAGHEVHIVTTEASVRAPVTIAEDRFSITYCPLRGPPRYRARVRALDLFEVEIGHLTAALRALAPDIVHAHWTYEFAEAALRSGAPHLVTMHDLGWGNLFHFRNLYRLMRLVMTYRTLWRVRHLAVVSPMMVARAPLYGYLRPVDLVPNGVEVPSGLRALPPDELARPILVTVGDVGPIKNVRASLAALQLIRRRYPEAQLHLFGPGLDAAFAASQPGVFAHGDTPHSELMAFLAERATILVHPSRLETFGVILAEAKVRGVPIVAGRRAGAVPYVCADTVSQLVDIEAPQAIADGVLELLSSPATHQRARQLSRQDAIGRFSITATAAAYTALYQRIAVQPAPAPSSPPGTAAA